LSYPLVGRQKRGNLQSPFRRSSRRCGYSSSSARDVVFPLERRGEDVARASVGCCRARIRAHSSTFVVVVVYKCFRRRARTGIKKSEEETQKRGWLFSSRETERR